MLLEDWKADFSLLKRLDISVQNTVNIVAACCTLHNVYELKKQEFLEDWLQNIDIDVGENIAYPEICRDFGLGLAIREEIKNWIGRNLL